MAKTTLTPSEIANAFAGKEFPVVLNSMQLAAATGSPAGMIVDRKLLVRSISLFAGTAGSSGTTTFQAHKNGSAITGAAVSIANDDADGTTVVAAPTSETTLEPGDRLELVCTAAAGSGADIYARILCVEVFD